MKMNCFYHAEAPHVAFCVQCGRPLCGECVRSIRGSAYCNSCLGAAAEGKNGKIVSIRDRFRRDESERREEAPEETLSRRDSDVPASGFGVDDDTPWEKIIRPLPSRRRMSKKVTKVIVLFVVWVTLSGVIYWWVARSGDQAADRQEAVERPAAPAAKAEEPAADCTMKMQMNSAPFLRIPLPPGGCDIRNSLVAPVVIRLDAAGEQGEFIAAPRGPMFKIVDGVEEPSSWKVLEGASEIWVRAKEEAFLFRLSPEAEK